jgi:polysaccharide chain length determinant protein (PEP-CTERM system associated)
MPELLEQQDALQFDYERYLNLVRRRHVYFLVPVLIGWLVVWGASWVLPAKYKSSTLILVEEPQMPESYVAPNVSENLQNRLQSITQQILSTTRLRTIIDKLNLYSDGSYKSTDDKVDAMRKDIGPVEIVKDARNNEISSFRVSFSDKDPRLAQQVTSELTQLFINENTRVRAEQSVATTRFMEQQLEDARVALAAQEAKVKQFEAAHEGALPSQQTSNLQILSGLQGQLQNQQDSLNTAKQQRVYDQSMIEQYKNLHASGRSADGGQTELGALNQQLEKLQSQLTDLSSHYTDSYPDVVRTKAQIAAVEKQKADLLAAPKTGSRQPTETESGPMLQLESQLQANQLEIQGRERAIAGLEARISEYQSRLNAQPGTEQELLDVSRGYEQSKAIYDDLLRKKTQSEMATSMEQLQKGERFTMLDPPSLPVRPSSPDRLKFCGMGIAVGIGLGCLVVFLMEVFDDRMHGEKELISMLELPVLAEVPEIQGAMEERKQKRQVVLGWALTSAIGLIIALGSTYSLLRG